MNYIALFVCPHCKHEQKAYSATTDAQGQIYFGSCYDFCDNCDRILDEVLDEAYIAEANTGRPMVTVADFYQQDHLVDEPVYMYNEENAVNGLDPWKLVDGIDKHTDMPLFDLWGSRPVPVRVSGDYRIFVSLKTFQKFKERS